MVDISEIVFKADTTDCERARKELERLQATIERLKEMGVAVTFADDFEPIDFTAEEKEPA